MMRPSSTVETARRPHLETVKTLLRYLWQPNRWDLRKRVLWSVGFLLCAKVVNVYVPFLYKGAVDQLSDMNPVMVLPLGLIVGYGLARILHQIFSELRDYVFVRVAQHAQRLIALDTFQHLHRLSLAFHLDRQTGGLSRIIERGVHGINFVLSFMVFNIAPTLLEIGLVTLVLWWKFPSIFAWVTLMTIVAYMGFTFLVTEWRLQYRRRMNEQDTEANTKAIDSLINYETVKYFGNEAHEFRRYNEALAQYELAAVQSQGSLSVLNVGQGAIIGVGLVLVMLYAAKGVVDQSMTLGDFVLVNTFLIQLYLPLNFLGFVYREVKQGLVNMDKMFELLEVPADVEDMPTAQELPDGANHICFDQVCFSYAPERKILNQVSFTVESGQTVAIVGPSGSGKSTLARLLFRFYDVSSGKILIGGLNIAQLNQHSLRSRIGIVPQDTVLFNDTIGYNIGYGRIGASQQEIEQAATLAEIHSFIVSLPQGYQTKVGERGLKLSGGEKQRVAIARMILKNPSILLFDEATSALDSHTEKHIQKAMRAVSKDKTTIMIAHRLSTVIDADQIIVLKDGGIVEQGTHQQLLTKGQLYRSMWDRQQQEQARDQSQDVL